MKTILDKLREQRKNSSSRKERTGENSGEERELSRPADDRSYDRRDQNTLGFSGTEEIGRVEAEEQAGKKTTAGEPDHARSRVYLGERKIEEIYGWQPAPLSSDPDLPASARKAVFLSSLREWILPIFLAVVLALFTRNFIGGATTVQGHSMEPTLRDGDVLIVSKIPTYSQDYQRMDVVILFPPDNTDGNQVNKGEERLFVKRIIGLPGETVSLKNGMIFINGLWLREYYLNEPVTAGYQENEWVLGEDEYLVMGDNRSPGRSNDGRLFGPIQADRIEGVVRLRIWPLDRIGGV